MQHDNQHGDNANFPAAAEAATTPQVASADQTPATVPGQSTREIIAALFASAEQNLHTWRDELPTVGEQLAFNNEVVDYLTNLTKSIRDQNSKINDEAKVEAALKELDELRASGCTDRKLLAAALAKANPTPKRKPKDNAPKVYKWLVKEDLTSDGEVDYTWGHNGVLKGTENPAKPYFKVKDPADKNFGKPDENYYRKATPEEIAEMIEIRDDWLEANGRPPEGPRANKA